MTKEYADNQSHPRRHAPRRRRGLLWAIVAAASLYAAGFGIFIETLPAPGSGAAAKADAIVALTGEGDRLGPAVMLLEAGRGQRLLITGVNRLTTKRELKTILHGGGSFDCCADLGFAATDTHGNAEEAALWVSEHRYGSVIVVTASYHMPRSLLEFAAQMPSVKLIPYPVATEANNTPKWQSWRRLHGEYAKYLASFVRISVTDLMRNA